MTSGIQPLLVSSSFSVVSQVRQILMYFWLLVRICRLLWVSSQCTDVIRAGTYLFVCHSWLCLCAAIWTPRPTYLREVFQLALALPEDYQPPGVVSQRHITAAGTELYDAYLVLGSAVAGRAQLLSQYTHFGSEVGLGLHPKWNIYNDNFFYLSSNILKSERITQAKYILNIITVNVIC